MGVLILSAQVDLATASSPLCWACPSGRILRSDWASGSSQESSVSVPSSVSSDDDFCSRPLWLSALSQTWAKDNQYLTLPCKTYPLCTQTRPVRRKWSGDETSKVESPHLIYTGREHRYSEIGKRSVRSWQNFRIVENHVEYNYSN